MISSFDNSFSVIIIRERKCYIFARMHAHLNKEMLSAFYSLLIFKYSMRRKC